MINQEKIAHELTMLYLSTKKSEDTLGHLPRAVTPAEYAELYQKAYSEIFDTLNK